MRIDLKSFEDVFDGRAGFVPRAILDLSRAAAPEVHRLMQNAVHGEDCLDEFWPSRSSSSPTAASLGASRCGRAHNPPKQVAIQLPVNEEFRAS